MAVKTITIDMAAYEALARRKQPGDSFSDVIKAHFGAGGRAKDLLAAARKTRVDEATLDRLDEVLTQRRRSRPRVPRL